MKIDVEGYESVVFDGAEKSLAKGRIRAMLVEFNAWNLKQLGIKASDLWKRIESWGFRSVEPQPAELDREGSCVNCFFRLP
jgi:hypothetical protein